MINFEHSNNTMSNINQHKHIYRYIYNQNKTNIDLE